jgi:hypothetical protein
LVSLYRVQYPVPLSLCFSPFSANLSAHWTGLDWNAIKITDTNFIELEQFCEDFGFMELGVKLSDFRPSINFKEGATASEAKQEQEQKQKQKRK